MIAFLQGNWKIGLWEAVDPYYHRQPSFSAPSQNGGGDRPRIAQFSELQKPRDLDLDLGSGRGHTGAHIWSSLPTHQITSISDKLFVDVRTDTHEFSTGKSIRSSPGDGLEIEYVGYVWLNVWPLCLLRTLDSDG